MTHPNYFLLKIMCVMTIVLAIRAPLAFADGSTVHVQTAGTDFMLWEAEDIDTDDIVDNGAGPQGLPVVVDKSGALATMPQNIPAGSSFTGSNVLTKGTNPSGGKALFLPDGGAFSGPFAYDFTYHLKFTEPGTYGLFYRYSAFERLSGPNDTAMNYHLEDSFFVPDDFNQLPTNTGNADFWVRQTKGGILWKADDGLFWGEGRFHWQGAELEDLLTFARYTVTPAMVGQVLDFTFSTREKGTTAFDSFLLTKDPAILAIEDETLLATLKDTLNAEFGTPEYQGDMDWDFDVDADDIAGFVSALNTPDDYEAEYEIPGGYYGDFTGDLPTVPVDSSDIPGFVAALFGGGMPAAAVASVSVPEPSSCVLLLLAIAVAGRMVPGQRFV